ncbi:hypothetical protein ALC60_08607 [Trachymyrmex zeteki]|uniref:Uncharacterized protein n=1 Tax=Mycetomoellerius zeteki TaxID=64791 RepID=A0A151WWK2_9HYME|nr:hypothetical protein ALC60_08607 [Trachymyrmex zeteki]
MANILNKKKLISLENYVFFFYQRTGKNLCIHVNKFGLVQHPLLSNVARDIWRWCEERNIYLFASYIASVDNVIADSESRISNTDTEWSLSIRAFNRINNTFGASLINTKVRTYISWVPDSWVFYAFPPIILLPRVLRKLYDDEATGVLVVPWWPSQPWFPMFHRLLISDLVWFAPSQSLLSSPCRPYHPEWKNLSLVAGKLSGKRSCCNPSQLQR